MKNALAGGVYRSTAAGDGNGRAVARQDESEPSGEAGKTDRSLARELPLKMKIRTTAVAEAGKTLSRLD